LQFKGRAYRAHDPRWSFAPTSGQGAKITGGRFNEKGTAALYLSIEPITALAECTQGFAHRMMPLTLCEYDVDCTDIVDLMTIEACEVAGIAPSDVGCGWLSFQTKGRIAPSQRAARQLIAKGAAGILVPSFVPAIHSNAVNLVLWNWGDELPHRISVYDPDRRLPSPI